MRKIPLENSKPGMVIAKPVYGNTGQILLKAGVEIKPHYLEHLRGLGIDHIYIQDSRIADVDVNDVISDEMRHEARNLVKNTLNNIHSSALQKKGVVIKNTDIIDTVARIIYELLDNRETIVQLVDIRKKADYLYAHSVNCCVLATLVATQLKYRVKDLRNLATGALLHDMGMVVVSERITNKSGELTPDEFEMVKQHPNFGFELLKQNALYNAQVGMIIRQHHERHQGQGYPWGLTGDKINPLAQILGIVDVYDALTSERPYRKAYYPHEAVEMLISRGGEYFDTKLLKHFLSAVAAYPVGFHVVLSNGESGLVVSNDPVFTLRPTVRVLYKGEDLAPHPAPYDLDLSKCLDLTIIHVLE